MKEKEQENNITRAPVVVVIGHIDHGKSTLLDYIRKTNVVDKEAGGITQHISAYEFKHKTKEGLEVPMTFLDTPGHESFSKIRQRGGAVADIAILVVSAEDSVKAQTLEAIKVAKENELPFVVAINKIDKPGADIEKTKMDLVEKEVYLEGYGGDVPFVPISAKKGDGVEDLLDLVCIMAELKDLKNDPTKNASGIVLESSMDPKRGISATIIIKDGTLKKGEFIVSGEALAPTRIFENFLGKTITEASFSSPVRIIGWDKIPKVGNSFSSFSKKNEAENIAQENKNSTKVTENKKVDFSEGGPKMVPIVIKADTSGSAEALEKEALAISNGEIGVKIIKTGMGTINESDMKMASSWPNSIILGFNVDINPVVIEESTRFGIIIKTSKIIYELKDWLKIELERQRPRKETDEVVGTAKILKIFNKMKERQIIGGKVLTGKIVSGGKARIMRRDFEIGRGEIINIESAKTKTREVEEGNEFGMMLETKTEIAPGDVLESFIVIAK